MNRKKILRILKLMRWRLMVVALMILSLWAVNALIYSSLTDLSITYLEALFTDITPVLLAWQLTVTFILIAFAGHEAWRMYKEYWMGARLEVSEDKFQTTFEKTDEAIMEADAEGTIVLANPAAARMLRYASPEELIGQSIMQLYTEPERRDEVFAHLKKKGSLDNVELTFRCKDGSTVCGLGSILAHRDDEGNVIGTAGFFTDINERKRMEDDLRKLRLAMEQSADGIAIIGQERKITFANNSFATMHGYEPAEVLGMQLKQFFFEDRMAEYRGHRKQIQRHGSVISEVIHRRKDGTPLPTLWSATAVKDNDGKFLGAVAVAKDITQRKQMEQQLKDYSVNLEKKVSERTVELQEAQEKLVRSEKLAAIGQLASGITHDLRNPLSVINNIAYYLRMRLPDADEKVNKYLDMLEKEVLISKNIINDLLDFVRVRDPEMCEVTVEAILENALRRTNIPNYVSLKHDMTDGLPAVYVDPDQMERVFVNIIDNAVRAMTSGGSLEIISALDIDYIIVRFTDTGHGVADDHMDKIFEPLFTTREKTGGTGIGLAICKSIVEAHNGSIDVESKDGDGSTFTIKLPVAGK